MERLVTKRYQYLATALCRCKERGRVPVEGYRYWFLPEKIRDDMELESWREDYIRDVLARVEGHASLVEDYLSDGDA